MSDTNEVSDASSNGSDPFSDGNTYQSMFRYDNLCLYFITRNDPGYTASDRKNSHLCVQAIQEAWHENRVNVTPFKDVPSKFLKIIPTEQLPEFTHLKEQFIATVVYQESQRDGGIRLEIDINPHNVINLNRFGLIPTFTESNELN
jgi:hypothetical protein